MSDEKQFRIPKLTESENWNIWVTYMQAYLIKEDLVHIFDDTVSAPIFQTQWHKVLNLI